VNEVIVFQFLRLALLHRLQDNLRVFRIVKLTHFSQLHM